MGRCIVDKAGNHFEALSFLCNLGECPRIRSFRRNQIVFSQGTAADAVFYIQKGMVKLAVASTSGKEAIVAILSTGHFFGEGCLAGQAVRVATASALGECAIVRIERTTMTRALHDHAAFSDLFITHLLSRNIRVEEDLVDQLFNCSERRLARALLLLANLGEDVPPDPIVPRMTQATLAEIVGTTRSRVSFFLNKFRKLGFIEYHDGLRVNSRLLDTVLRE
jgi:CRP-like cAMP-binding protein